MEKKTLRYRTAIVIPCYNEAARLQIESFRLFLNSNPNYFMCFVNDGSSDQTSELLNQLALSCENAALVELKENSGKAVAVYKGTRYCIENLEVSNIGYFDADLATPLSFIKILETTLNGNTGYNLVFGSRQLAKKQLVERKFFRHIMGRMVARMISWAIGKRFGDTQCGAKLMTVDAAEKVFDTPFISTWIFDAEIIKRLGPENGIKEIPVNQWKDVGNSKVSPWYFFRLLGEIWRIRGIKTKTN